MNAANEADKADEANEANEASHQATAREQNVRFVSVESPYNALNPVTLLRNRQYAALCNTHAASFKDATWAPHLCNTQVVYYGIVAFIGDTFSAFLFSTGLFKNTPASTYSIGRDETLRVTNAVRATKCDAVICYTDYGMTNGMELAAIAARNAGVRVIERRLPLELKRHVIGESIASTVVPCGIALVLTSTCGVGTYTMLRAGFKLARRVFV